MDRAQPGAKGSIVHNIEAGESWGQAADGWVVPSTQPTRSSQAATGIDDPALNAFDETHSATSLTVTIDPGEAFVDGWLARDVATNVALAASTAEQTVFVGWDVSVVYSSADDADRDAADTVIVGLASAFGDLDPTIPLWTFDTDGSGVTSVSDERLLSRHADRPAAHHNPASVSDPLTEDGAQGLGLTLGDGVTVSGSALAAAVANGLTLDANGDIRVEADGVTEDMLAFATATKTELNDHAGVSDVHHGRYSNDEARAALQDGTRSIRFNNIEFGDIADTEARLAWDNSEGLRFYWNGAWRQIYSRGPTNDSPTHGELENVLPGNHHTKTSSASELSDVSPDSESDAHHTQPTQIDTGGVTSQPESGGDYSNPYSSAAVVEVVGSDENTGSLSVIVQDSAGRDVLRLNGGDVSQGGTMIVGPGESYRIRVYDGGVRDHRVRELVI